MSDIAIKFENISKQYRLGLVSTKTLSHDLNRWWQTSVLRKEDPYLKIGETNDRSKKGESDYVWALKDIDFEVKQGDVLGIIGKNGAGKSTLLKILSRVTSPTTGTIKAKGRIASLLEVGTGFHPELTGRENIYMNGAVLGMTKSEIDRKLDEIIDFAGVERYIDTPSKRYSSGMTVRLGFAIAAHLDPEILVVDEVLAVGDAEFQKKAIGKMQDVSQGEGRTVLFVSHNMASIRRLCNRGVLLGNGTVESIGDIETITNLYIRSNNPDLMRIVKFEKDLTREVSITEISIEAEGKGSDVIFDVEDTLKVTIKYFVKKDIAKTNISCTLNRDGIPILKSWDIDSNQEVYDIRKVGEYKAEIILPKLINIGSYTITVACGIVGFKILQKIDDVLNFDIENNIVEGRTNGYTRGGILKMSIPWSIVKL